MRKNLRLIFVRFRMQTVSKVRRYCVHLKRILKRAVFLLVFFIPILLLKVKAGISFKESKAIIRYWAETTCCHKKYPKAIKVLRLFFKVSWRGFSPEYSLFHKSEYAKEVDAWSIGRWYAISPEEEEKTELRRDSPKMKYFSIGREAIAHILKTNTFRKKMALLPVFTCFTVLEPFLRDEWEIKFYRYNKDLSVDAAYFTEVFQEHQPSVCIFQPLSGMGFLEAENELIEFAYNHECMTVVDQTQDIYNARNNGFVDYYCGSLRKWYPFPDGAFLYSEKHGIAQCEGLKENYIYQTAMGLCMFAEHLRSRYDNPYFKYLCKFLWTFSTSYIHAEKITSHTMSSFSRKILSLQDEEFNSKRRLENFRCIYQGIQGLKNVRPAFGTIDRLTGVPLSFPVYVENRRKFSAYLTAHGITTQLLWSKPAHIAAKMKLDEASEYTYSHILSLPCDQRYNLEDMKRMVEVICAYDRK